MGILSTCECNFAFYSVAVSWTSLRYAMGLTMDRRVVITGVGIVAPKSLGAESFWSNLSENNILYEEIRNDFPYDLGMKFGGQINYPLPNEKFKSRFLHKCDNFSIFALHAVKEALEDAGLDLDKTDRDRIGIYVGNSAGGWKSAQEGLYSLHTGGSKAISPYLASNWFPAAPQGHVSIYFGLKGYSKTVTADMASSGIAINNAYQIIKYNRADYMLAGGTENILVPWGMMFYRNNGVINLQAEDKEKAYLPFCEEGKGIVLAEGAAFLLLEELSHARKRGAQIYCEITGSAITNDGRGENPSLQYARCMSESTKKKVPELIYINGTAVKEQDHLEEEAINLAFKERAEDIMLTCPKVYYGHAYGAATAMDMVAACCSFKHKKVIGTKLNGNVRERNKLFLPSVNMQKRNLKNCLVISRGLGGINSSIFLSSESCENSEN